MECQREVDQRMEGRTERQTDSEVSHLHQPTDSSEHFFFAKTLVAQLLKNITGILFNRNLN
jgi:hypothetical protein